MQVFITLVSSELCCLYLRICHTSEDIDVAPYASHSLIPLLAISLVLSIGSYEATELVLHDMLKLLRLLSIIWAVIMISLSIAVFISGMILAEDEYREDTWNRLTPLGKEYYDDD